jgi:hypothetical protein
MGTCLLNRCPETDLVYPLISPSLHSNGTTRYNINIMILCSLYNWSKMGGETSHSIDFEWKSAEEPHFDFHIMQYFRNILEIVYIIFTLFNVRGIFSFPCDVK